MNTSAIIVTLAPSWEFAKRLSPEATVEAEYGANVLEGSVITLAHHVEAYRHCNAPCNQEVPILDKGQVVVSHLDLDTIGGVLALMGSKPKDDAFWVAAEFIDLNGSHHLHKLDMEVKAKLIAYYAWAERNHTAFARDQISEVTDEVLRHGYVIHKIISGDAIELIREGEQWEAERAQSIEDCLFEEDEKIRVFVSKDVFTAAGYYSPNLKCIASVTVNFNTKHGSITIATSDNSIICRDVMQELFGPEAGGHAGIAGSPRGIRLNRNDLNRTVEKVRELLG